MLPSPVDRCRYPAFSSLFSAVRIEAVSVAQRLARRGLLKHFGCTAHDDTTAIASTVPIYHHDRTGVRDRAVRLHLAFQTQNGRRADRKPSKPAPRSRSRGSRNNRFRSRSNSIGSVQALNRVVVRSRVDGQIENIFFAEGQTVKVDDLLIKLDARPFRAALDQALAKKAQDEATLNNAKLDLQRYAKLAKSSFATEQQLNTQQAAVASGEAQVTADQAAIENAQTQLGYTEIRAPIAGRIGFRQIDLGNIVHAGDAQPMLSIVQVDPIFVLFTVPEDRIYEVQQAMNNAPLVATVYTSDKKVELATGTLAVIDNTIDVASGTVQLKAIFDNAQMRLWPGESVNVRLHVRDLDKALVVSSQAVLRGRDGLYVWLVAKDNLATVRKIEVSMQAGGRAVVTSGSPTATRS